MSDVLNQALRLSLEFGPDWGKPVDARLLEKFPSLSAAEARSADVLCRAIHEFAFAGIAQVYHQKETEEVVRAAILAKWPWLDAETLAHLWSQGMYYAWHG